MKKKIKGMRKDLTTKKLVVKIQDVRKIVVEQMKRKQLTAYAVAKRSGVTVQTVSNFISGGTEMTSGKLSRVFTVLDIEIKPKK